MDFGLQKSVILTQYVDLTGPILSLSGSSTAIALQDGTSVGSQNLVDAMQAGNHINYVNEDILLLGRDKGKDLAVYFVVTHPLQAGLNHSLPQISYHLRSTEDGKISENLGVHLGRVGLCPGGLLPMGGVLAPVPAASCTN